MFFTLPSLWAFVALLATHWVGDFFLQSHWMSLNKSKRLDVLLLHISIYTAVLFMGAGIIFWRQPGWNFVGFVGLNGILHCGTDYVTSRITSSLWKQERIHDFFVMIGVDQFIHQITLAATMAWLLENHI